MSTWVIAYQRDNNTEQLDLASASKPSIEAAASHLLQWAESNLEAGDFSDAEDSSNEPAHLLLTRYGITISGITRA
ncbi:hypothetical protein [Pseudomonas sp. LRF_L74]|uniref:hypothetical protein n=1 Tax=Pseudomonas sp. LRF_L74 TaxID=3369422 RepID=UPI003F63CC6B